MLNRKVLARSATVATMATLAIWGGHAAPTVAQERQGCFLVRAGRPIMKLDHVCPRPTPFLLPGRSEDGLGTGDIQVTLSWETTDDLDLSVTGPDAQSVSWNNPGPSSSGGRIDRDDNSACAAITQSPLENIYWPAGQGAEGEYSIDVDLFGRCAEGNEPISFDIRLLVQGVTETITGTVSDTNPTFTHRFSVPLQTP